MSLNDVILMNCSNQGKQTWKYMLNNCNTFQGINL